MGAIVGLLASVTWSEISIDGYITEDDISTARILTIKTMLFAGKTDFSYFNLVLFIFYLSNMMLLTSLSSSIQLN